MPTILAMTDRLGGSSSRGSPTRCQPEKHSKEEKGITSNSQSILYVMSNSRNMYW